MSALLQFAVKTVAIRYACNKILRNGIGFIDMVVVSRNPLCVQ